MINYKQFLLEALNEHSKYDDFVTLHNVFIDSLKNNCASYTKVKDTFDNKHLKNEWYREYHFECAENNTIVLQLTNQRKSKTDNDYGKWNIKCLCDVTLGELIFNDDFTRRFIEIINNEQDVLSALESLCNQFSHSSDAIANQQSFDQLVNTLTASFKARVTKQSIVFDLDQVTISLFDNNTHWEVRGEMKLTDFGDIALNENTADDIEDCVAKLAFNMPKTLLTELVEKNKNAKPDYIKNGN